MKSIIKTLTLTLVVLAALPSFSAVAYDMRQPLVIIRFNDPSVSYHNSLGMAVGEAVRVKPTVAFDILAGRNVTAQGTAVARQIMAQGINPANITMRTNNNSLNEVMVFVR